MISGGTGLDFAVSKIKWIDQFMLAFRDEPRMNAQLDRASSTIIYAESML